MRSVNSWNLTNNELHQLFKDNSEFISIKVRGNTWEPISRWLRLDSRIFRETTSKARITLCDIESLAEIYNYRSIRWKAKKLTPVPTKVIPHSIKNIFRKIPIIKQLAYELEIVFYKYSENISEHLISIVIPARNEAGNKELLINAGYEADTALIKRVFGIPGDKVEVRDGNLYLNDIAQNNYVFDKNINYSIGPFIVPEESLWVMGDNRNNSMDSHIWGFLPYEKVIGKAIFRYWPFNKIGPIRFPALNNLD